MKRKPKSWVAYITEGRCDIAIGRKGSEDAPVLVFGKSLKRREWFARRIARLMTRAGM